MSGAEVMTTAIAAALCFGGNCKHARRLLDAPHYIPEMPGKSRFNRRWHALAGLFAYLFQLLGEVFKHLDTSSTPPRHLLDSFRAASWDNLRIPRARLHRGRACRGYAGSERRYCCGLKLHLVVTATGEPVAMLLTPDSVADVAALKMFDLDLPPGSLIHADKDHALENLLREAAGTDLSPIRKRTPAGACPWRRPVARPGGGRSSTPSAAS